MNKKQHSPPFSQDDEEEKQSLLRSEDISEEPYNSATTGKSGPDATTKLSSTQTPAKEYKHQDTNETNSPPLRTFDINTIKVNRRLFDNNQITTSKYTVISFLPKNLIDQFSKLANIYFLIMSILQCIPSVSITNGQPTILLPLLIVVTVSAIKDIFEDMKRHNSDYVENTRNTLRLSKKKKAFIPSTWKNLKVGQIVQVTNEQYFPADLILLKSANSSGLAYVETKNLDGETNLKHKSCLKEIHQAMINIDDAVNLRGQIVCETPNEQLYKFEGTLTFNDRDTFSLDHNNLLLRGTSLRNTDWVYGLVIYSGHDTRIMMNSSKARTKFSNLETQTNRQIVFIFLFQILICIGCASLNQMWTLRVGKELHPYLGLKSSDTPSNDFTQDLIWDSITRFGTWLLLLANFVPVSLIVSLEVVKFIQAQFIQWDIEIYDQTKDLATKVQTSNLNEQLGQVDYVFSDKTGTLTCNLMEYRKQAIGKFSYGVDGGVCRDAAAKGVTNFNLYDEVFVQHLNDKTHENHQNIVNFLTHLAICHTVVAEEKEGQILYNASSPDELALVNAAKYFGYFFVGRDEENNIEVNIQGKRMTYTLLNVIEFSSDRKRMTVVVKDQNGVIKVMCKGADSVIQARLRDDETNQELLKYAEQHLENYAKCGLRTLLLAEKVISEIQYAQWKDEYRQAASAMVKRDDRMAEVAEKLELQFDLIGATAIEDKLQDDVDKAISAMKKAGIKVWVLTGDKVETAINIGFSCQLLNDKMELYIINGTDKQECLNQIAESRMQQVNSEGFRSSGTVVSGESLFKIMSSERITKQFLKLATSSSVLIACRMSPKQKADIVRLIQRHDPRLTTLAIGDGANDVNMINAAHIGVGISGVEGQQAVSASDYAIGQFKYLKNLLFVHGRESYRKNSYLVCYQFYKNVLFVLPQLWFGFYTAFSGQVFYEKWIYQAYNITVTAVPILIFAINDWQYTKEELMSQPKLYKLGLKNQCFGTIIFWKWIIKGILQGGLIFFMCFVPFTWGGSWNGKLGDLWMSGTCAYGSVVILVNMTMLHDSYSHTIFSVLINLLSSGFFFLAFYITSYIGLPILDGMFQEILSFPIYIFISFYFVMFAYPTDGFLHFITQWQRDREVQVEKELKRKKKRKFTKGLDPTKLAPIQRYTGYAFSGEAGHAPQITEKLFRTTTTVLTTQRFIGTMKNAVSQKKK